MFTEEVTADSTMPADTIVKLIDFGHGFIIQSDNSPGTFLGTREILPPVNSLFTLKNIHTLGTNNR